MFNQEVDVAKIMHELKASVQVENNEETADIQGAVAALRTEIEGARVSYYPHLIIGERLPSALRWPKPLRKVVQFMGRIVRKMNKFIIYDQRIVNQNMDICLDNIVKREDYMLQLIDNSIRDLKLENKLLKDQIKLLRKEIDDMNITD